MQESPARRSLWWTGNLFSANTTGQDVDFGPEGGGGRLALDAVGGNNSSISLNTFSSNTAGDDDGIGWKAFGGVTWKYIGAELAWVGLGQITTSFEADTTDVNQLPADAAEAIPTTGDGPALSAILQFPFSDQFAIFGKVGAYFWESDVKVDLVNSSERVEPQGDGTDMMYGIGGQMNIGRLGVRLEAERYEIGNHDTDLLSMSLLWNFGSK